MDNFTNAYHQQGSFDFIPVTHRDIELEIKTLPAKKDEGLYSCPYRVLKGAQHILSKPLADIFNSSIKTGIYPNKLKIAKIMPIYKSDDETDPNNYRPISQYHQKSLNFQPVIKMLDYDSNQYIPLECKEYVKYLGIIIDCNLNWKYHINYVTQKISKTVGIISKLRYYIPNNTLLDIYKSLISPYLTYGIVAAKVHIQKLLVLQKRAVRLMNFKSYQDHAIPLFLSTGILPVTMIYVEESSIIIYDILKPHLHEQILCDKFYGSNLFCLRK